MQSARKDEDTSKWTALTESALRIERSVISPFSKYKTVCAFLYFEVRRKRGTKDYTDEIHAEKLRNRETYQ